MFIIFVRQVKFYEHVCARLCALVASAPVACFPTLVSCALLEFWVPMEVSYLSNVSFISTACVHTYKLRDNGNPSQRRNQSPALL